MKSSITLTLLGLAPYMAQAQKSTTHYSSTTVFIPPAATGSATNIYASIITSDDSSTKYLLGCQTQLDASTYSCSNDFSGITYTRYASSIDVQFGVTSFGCETGNDRAICASKTATEDAETRTLTSSESSLWMTAITFVDVKKRKTTAAATQATETSSPKLCKRKVRDHAADAGGSGSGTGTGSTGSDTDADADTDGGSGSSVNKKPKTDDQDCSAASIISLSWAVMAMGLGGYLGLNLA
ncbi:hypothetical protein FLONG3_5337 [Fusarium longipes]|uniref:Gpi anchored n=1 Tax=Fusarium longipes TaxID=694270 RepID=A0A395SVD5_9HYPO|nr:hypothetical protein FLONG3_5337 [Fusarium longipes]